MATHAGLLEPHWRLERHEGPSMWGCTFSFSLSSLMAERWRREKLNRHEKEEGKYKRKIHVQFCEALSFFFEEDLLC